MAIGDNSNNGNGNNRLNENTYYSRLRIKNDDEKQSLSISFKSGLMIFSIDHLVEGFKYESSTAIHISPTKARILSEEMKKFFNYLNTDSIEENVAFGINAGMSEKVSYIGFHSNANKDVLITIGKIDNNGNILESFTITLNKNYHFGLEWSNINDMVVSKSYNDNIELYQLKDICDDFARSMSGAIAYSVTDLARYDLNRILKKMDPLYDKLGIERLSSGNNNRNYQRGNNFIDNSKSVSSNHTSVDDVEDFFGDDN